MSSPRAPSARTRGWPTALVLIGMAACSEPPATGLPDPGSYELVALDRPERSFGQLEISADWRGGATARLSLVGAHWMTPGTVSARLEHGEVGGAPASWLAFPLRTAVGEAEAVARVQGQSVVVPLGARPGEHELALALRPAGAPVSAAHAAAEAKTRIDALAAGWGQGRLRLVDGDQQLVGEVLLQGEHPPLVGVYDRHWMTPGAFPVPAGRSEEGGDLLLSFPVEPSLQGEQAMLRINVPTQQVVVPLGPAPEPEERRLSIALGEVGDEERDVARRRARAQADREEQTFLRELGPRLHEALRAATGTACRPRGSLAAHWDLLLAGYELSTTTADGGCAVWLTPAVEQHRRRHRLRVWGGGALEVLGPAG